MKLNKFHEMEFGCAEGRPAHNQLKEQFNKLFFNPIKSTLAFVDLMDEEKVN